MAATSQSYDGQRLNNKHKHPYRPNKNIDRKKGKFARKVRRSGIGIPYNYVAPRRSKFKRFLNWLGR